MPTVVAPNKRPNQAVPAIRYTAILLLVALLVPLAGGAALWGTAGDVVVARWFAVRIGAFLGLLAVSNGLARYLCGGDLSLRAHFLSKGDVGGFLGVLAACMTAAALKPSMQASLGGPNLVSGSLMEIAGPTLGGKPFDLAQERGKVVVVDFWATWCGPCRAELPNLVRLYDRYHDDGLQVIGISLDDSKEALEQFLKEQHIPWPQIFFAEAAARGWNHPLSRRYGVDRIPFTLVIDQNGRLAGADLRGAELDSAVAQLLGQPLPWSERFEQIGAKLLQGTLAAIFQMRIRWLLPIGLAGAVFGALIEAALWRARRRGAPNVLRPCSGL